MILVDTGPVVAVANKNDGAHDVCTRYLTTVAEPLLMPAPVLTEVCYFLETRGSAELSADFLADMWSNDREVTPVQRGDLRHATCFSLVP